MTPDLTPNATPKKFRAPRSTLPLMASLCNPGALTAMQEIQIPLDAANRRRLIALIAIGASRPMAARYLGCTTSAILRTAAGDPEFARQLAAAEQDFKAECLRVIRAAARKNPRGQAAAWLRRQKPPKSQL